MKIIVLIGIGIIAITALVLAIICLLKKEKYLRQPVRQTGANNTSVFVIDTKGNIGIEEVNYESEIQKNTDAIAKNTDAIASLNAEVMKYGDKMHLQDPDYNAGIVVSGTSAYVPGCGGGGGSGKGCMGVYAYGGNAGKATPFMATKI